MMKLIGLQEEQEIELDILRSIDAFCLERGIRYWVVGGTLLGTIRHQGFIPWDDDIDIGMPREDYDRFCAEYRDPTGRYRVRRYPEEKTWPYPYAKVEDTRTVLRELDTGYQGDMGIYVDIFPQDGFPEGREAAEAYLLKNKENAAKNWNRQLAKLNFSSLRKIVGSCKVLWMRLTTSRDHFQKKLTTQLNPVPFDGASQVGFVLGGYGVREITPAEVYSKVLRMPFEDMQVNVPVGYDIYMTNLYGDYMTPPPEDKRVQAHNTQIYWREA